jgi:hypothetical protein
MYIAHHAAKATNATKAKNVATTYRAKHDILNNDLV